jgi:hypothetical protein
MAKTIFKHSNNTRTETLVLNDDGSLTYSYEYEGWAAAKHTDFEKQMTAAEAKERWPQHASKIDEASQD